MAMAFRKSGSLLLREASAARLLTMSRAAGIKTWCHLGNSWPNGDGGSPPAASGASIPEGSTSSRDLDGAAGGAKSWDSSDKFVSGSSKPGTGKTWPNPNAPRDVPTYTPSSYSSSSKGGGKLWDNPNGLPYWDSKWDDPTKPELRAKGWTWDPNPANSHMGTWPADQPPPNRSPLGFGPRGGGGGGSWGSPRPGGGGGGFQQGGGGGGGFPQGGGGGGGFPQGGGGGGFQQGGGPPPPQGGGFQQQGGPPPQGGPGGFNQQGGGFQGGNQGPPGSGFNQGNQGGGGGGSFPGGNQGGGGFNR